MTITTPKVKIINLPSKPKWVQPKEPKGVPTYAEKTKFIDEFLIRIPEVMA